MNGCVPRSLEGLLFVSDLHGLPFCSGATATVAGSGDDDDHANSEEGATAVSVAEAASGVLEHYGDTDLFVFQSEEGVLYQIDVALGTLSDSTIALHDADGRELAYNDDHGDSLASRIFWEAPTSGEHYVEVAGLGSSGSYTLTVEVSDIVDDHANSEEGATAVSVAEAASGVLEHYGDTDFFVFQSEEGVLYQIDVALGTLSDSTVALNDADGWELAYNDDHGDSLASRIFWEAPTSGEHYVAVAGLVSSGSYTLTVAVR